MADGKLIYECIARTTTEFIDAKTGIGIKLNIGTAIAVNVQVKTIGFGIPDPPRTLTFIIKITSNDMPGVD